MGDAMVTGRMSEQKKQRASRVLARQGLSASQAINLLYDRIIAEGATDFLLPDEGASADAWQAAARFVDGISAPQASRFDTMGKAEIKRDRLAARGLM